jgi:hypothetical protein
VKATFTPHGGTAITIPKSQLSQPQVEPLGWACGCGATGIAGKGKRIATRDTYEADAFCVGCGEQVGVLRAKVETIFGLEEDEAVLNGRWKVY